MALVNCPECGREISNRAEICPHCGLKMDEETIKEVLKEKAIPYYLEDKTEDRTGEDTDDRVVLDEPPFMPYYNINYGKRLFFIVLAMIAGFLLLCLVIQGKNGGDSLANQPSTTQGATPTQKPSASKVKSYTYEKYQNEKLLIEIADLRNEGSSIYFGGTRIEWWVTNSYDVDIMVSVSEYVVNGLSVPCDRYEYSVVPAGKKGKLGNQINPLMYYRYDEIEEITIYFEIESIETLKLLDSCSITLRTNVYTGNKHEIVYDFGAGEDEFMTYGIVYRDETYSIIMTPKYADDISVMITELSINDINIPGNFRSQTIHSGTQGIYILGIDMDDLKEKYSITEIKKISFKTAVDDAYQKVSHDVYVD